VDNLLSFQVRSTGPKLEAVFFALSVAGADIARRALIPYKSSMPLLLDVARNVARHLGHPLTSNATVPSGYDLPENILQRLEQQTGFPINLFSAHMPNQEGLHFASDHGLSRVSKPGRLGLFPHSLHSSIAPDLLIRLAKMVSLSS